ncbi:hypothetical protein BHF71_00855 [Vulcanibacillus modesticaldus]|uniref:Glycosyltransferase 2-like domain-containing protein n=1 Tax=Vulcanibacillus modesticaldus TaxID=337097 RepID=A0A1D2YVU5_9BACI|nr:hypothetical protein [Vulcanibacillus modesticaldus]OEF99756.1 hypothetical protein BHF71_00855 [Vulcanibacillus modesticaldus]
MFYFYLGILTSLFLYLKVRGSHFRPKMRKKTKLHYFILVKNSQANIEWVIRWINFWSWIRGKQTRITVIDLGSEDDTLDILERLLYPKKKIDRLYSFQPNQQDLIDSLIKESNSSGEQQIIINVTNYENSTSTTR